MSKTAILNAKLDTASELSLVGAIFQHYKGGVYAVDGLVIDTDDGEIRVLYSRVDGPGFDEYAEAGIQFVRPILEFLDEVDGAPRFQRVERVTTWVPLIDGEYA